MTRVRVTAPTATAGTLARGASRPHESREAAQDSEVG